jgi:hypothetical protein
VSPVPARDGTSLYVKARGTGTPVVFVFPGAGHLVKIEDAERFNRLLGEFLAAAEAK